MTDKVSVLHADNFLLEIKRFKGEFSDLQGVSKKVYSWKKSANATSTKCLNEL